MNSKLLQDAMELPSALESFSQIISDIKKNGEPLIFLDFDGTLALIVDHHADAAISEEMKDLVKQLAIKFPLAIVSGRGLEDVSQKAGIKNIYYAGSHGFEISGPNGFKKDHEEAIKVLPIFEEIEPILRDSLKDIQGIDFERKKFTLAIHYRQVSESREEEVHRNVLEIMQKYPELSRTSGKKVIEIRPSFDWHKGKAVEFLKKALSKKEDPLSIYIGDDVTDEDAFAYVTNGLGIIVGEHGEKTSADYKVENIEEVKIFLAKLLRM